MVSSSCGRDIKIRHLDPLPQRILKNQRIRYSKRQPECVYHPKLFISCLFCFVYAHPPNSLVFCVKEHFVVIRKMVAYPSRAKPIEVKEKGSIRYYGKPGWDKLIRVDYHGSRLMFVTIQFSIRHKRCR